MTIGTISTLAGLVLLVLIKFLFKDEKVSDQSKELHGGEQDELFKEDLDFDPSWAVLSSNTHHTEDD